MTLELTQFQRDILDCAPVNNLEEYFEAMYQENFNDETRRREILALNNMRMRGEII